MAAEIEITAGRFNEAAVAADSAAACGKDPSYDSTAWVGDHSSASSSAIRVRAAVGTNVC